MAVLADQAARDRILGDLDTTLIVEAAAGTGKTTALVGRIVAAVTAGRALLSQILAVTFTEAAAGELKLRIRSEIERVRQKPDLSPVSRRLLEDSLPQLEEARIATIHSVCADLLRLRPVEAGLDPRFEVAVDDVQKQLFGLAFDRWFELQLDRPSPGVKRILRRRVRYEDGPRLLLRRAAENLAEWRDFPTAWTRRPFSRDSEIDDVMRRMAAVASLADQGEPEDWLTLGLLEIARVYGEIQRREAIDGSRDYDGLEAEFIGASRGRHWGWKGRPRARHRFDRDEATALRDDLLAALKRFNDDAGADLACYLQDELMEVVARYEEVKAQSGRVDFIDLLIRARDLVRDNAGVREELQKGLTHIFVDEFQDTDPLQAEILLLLAADDPREECWENVRPVQGKLFIVGDPKQSIYRFRRADVTLYEDVKRRLLERGAERVDLQVSFRAVPAIQEAINAAFSLRMTGTSPGQTGYVSLLPHRASTSGQPAIVCLPVPRPYGKWSVANYAIDASFPAAVASFVQWLLQESGWTVTERGGELQPVQARHICLLNRRFRSFGNDLTRAYVQALEAREIPHVLVGGTSFHVREEVEAIRNALTAIEWPEDELAVYATLRGPLFALSDAQLLGYRQRVGRLQLYRILETAEGEEAPATLLAVSDALGVLRELRRDRNRRPISVTLSRLLKATRAQAGLAIWPTGEQALANVTRLMDMARRVEQAGIVSFRGFVTRLHDEAESGEMSEAPILEEGTEGVRLMTVHKAKGLEFPVVILCDPTAGEGSQNPSRWVDPLRRLCAMRLAGCSPADLLEHAEEEVEREEQESVRLLYVAATRARDLLVVATVGDQPFEGWLQALEPALHPPRETCRSPRPADGCPPFGSDSVLERPENRECPDSNVAPGEHAPQAGTHRVVWWDPHVLKLDVEVALGQKQQKLLAADDDGLRSEAGIQEHAAWQAERRRTRASASVSSLKVVTATELARSDESEGLPVELAVVPRTGERPHGMCFGTLVHAILAAVDLDADESSVAAQTEMTGRMLGASAEEMAGARQTVVQTLSHPCMRQAAEAHRRGECRREVPLTLRLGDGALLEGVADLAFLENGRWTVIDFKTDIDLSGRLEEYRRQVGWYVQAIETSTRLPARAVLLQI